MQPSDFIVDAKNSEAAVRAIEQYKEANRLFTNMRILEKSKIFGKISRVKQLRLTDEPEQVLLTLPGRGSEVQTLTAADLGRTAFDAKDPSMVKTLRTLVGDDTLQKAVRMHISKSFDDGITVLPDGQITINAGVIKNNLGFDKARKAAKEAVDEGLKGTGVTAKDFDDIVSVLENVNQPIKPSELIKRRIALGGPQSGLRGALGGIVPFGAAAGGSVGAKTFGMGSAIITLGLVRRASTILSRPKTLKRLMSMTRDSTSLQQKSIVAREALDIFFTEEEKEEVGFNEKGFMDDLKGAFQSEIDNQ